MTLLHFVGIYLIGFLITLTFLKFFGKKLGFDYDPPHEYYYDDYKSNAEAYLSFSLFWPVVLGMGLIIGPFILLFKFGEWYLK